MFSHINLGVSDVARAVAFYDAVLEPLGLVRSGAWEEGAGWEQPGDEGPAFYICLPFDEKPASVGNGTMVAFQAGSPDVVDAVHARAIAAGATDEGAPGRREIYSPEYYGGYFRDLDGNKICVCCHTP